MPKRIEDLETSDSIFELLEGKDDSAEDFGKTVESLAKGLMAKDGKDKDKENKGDGKEKSDTEDEGEEKSEETPDSSV